VEDAVLVTRQVGHVEKANNAPPVSGAGIDKIAAAVTVAAVEDGTLF